MPTYYHKTDSENLEAIEEHGLRPASGIRALYLSTIEPSEKALAFAASCGQIWLAVEVNDDSDFREDPEFSRLMPGTAWTTERTIPWRRITVLGEVAQ